MYHCHIHVHELLILINSMSFCVCVDLPRPGFMLFDVFFFAGLILSVRIINFLYSTVFCFFQSLFTSLSHILSLSLSLPVSQTPVLSHRTVACLLYGNSLPIISNISFIFDDKSPIVALKQL